ncbi:MAG: type IV pilus biogenesis/stability protein PilW [Sulfuricaulis sp.]
MNARLLNIAMLLLVVALAGCASTAERQAERDKLNERVGTHVMLGASYLERDQLAIANQELDEALKESPDNSQANNVMGVLQWRLKYYDKAEHYFRKALDDDGNSASAHHNYGAFLCDRGRLDEGVQQFDAAAANHLYAYTADVDMDAGVCLMKKPDPVAAEKYFREALRINPKLPEALYRMAKISLDTGRLLSAQGFVQRYLQSAGQTPEILLLAVKTERELGHQNAAASYAFLLRNKFANSPEAGQLRMVEDSGRK